MEETKDKLWIKVFFNPGLLLLVRRIARFRGLPVSEFLRVAVENELYRLMRGGMLEHPLLRQPITQQERDLYKKWFETGKVTGEKFELGEEAYKRKG